MTAQSTIDAKWTDLKRTLLDDRGYAGAEEYLAFALEIMKREREIAERRDGENVVHFAP